MINGAHAIVYSTKPEADRAFLRDVLKLPSVDAGEGWLIFGLPPAEVAVHPAEENDVHELYFLCDDVSAFVAAMQQRGVTCSEVFNRGWGLLTQVTLPGGGKLGVYQPRHARPRPAPVAPPGRAARKPRAVAGRTRATKSVRRGTKQGGKTARNRPVKSGRRR
jgi:hypothetical protein